MDILEFKPEIHEFQQELYEFKLNYASNGTKSFTIALKLELNNINIANFRPKIVHYGTEIHINIAKSITFVLEIHMFELKIVTISTQIQQNIDIFELNHTKLELKSNKLVQLLAKNISDMLKHFNS